LCSPSTHVMASATLLLPHPLGPTIAVTPWSNASSERSEKDLNPAISRRSRRIGILGNGSDQRSANRLTAPSHCGKRLSAPQHFGLGTHGGIVWPFGSGQRPAGRNCQPPAAICRLSRCALRARDLAHLEQTLGIGEERHRELQLRIALHQILARGLDAEQIE